MLQAVVDRLNNSGIHWFTDNQNVVRILTVGSGKGCLQDVALQKFALCMSRAIHIEPEWIPREQNELADYISRIVDYDDCFVNPAVFAWVNKLWVIMWIGLQATTICICPDLTHVLCAREGRQWML